MISGQGHPGPAGALGSPPRGRSAIDPAPLSCGAAQHDPDGWKVMVHPASGGAFILTSEQARWLSAELIKMADICEGKWGE